MSQPTQASNAGSARFGLTSARIAPMLIEVDQSTKTVTHADLVKHIRRFDAAAVSCTSNVPLRVLVSSVGQPEVCGLSEGTTRLICMEHGSTMTMSSLHPGTVRLEVLLPYLPPQ